MSEVQLRVYTGSESADILERVADVYDEVYAEPPYNSGPLFAREEFLQRTRSQLTADGFALIVATVNDAFAGFTFGFSLGNRWWGGETTPLPVEIQQAALFAVIELVVRQPFRGSGLGRTLLTTLLAKRPEAYATLLSVPEAPAHEMYGRWGWRKVGTVQPTPYAPVMDAMVLPLTEGR